MLFGKIRVNACEILNDKIGDLDTDKIPNNFFQFKEAKKLRNKIKDTKCKCKNVQCRLIHFFMEDDKKNDQGLYNE